MLLSAYFRLQYRRFERRLHLWGIAPIWAIPAMAIGFCLFSVWVLGKGTYAPYAYGLLALFTVGNAHAPDYNDFLREQLPSSTYRLLRVVENGLIAIPFVIILLLASQPLVAIVTALTAVALAWLPTHRIGNWVLPTPFYHLPFEAISGFRRLFWAWPLAVFLLVKAVQVGNYELGVAALAFVMLMQVAFHTQTEAEVLIWMHSRTPHTFLHHKLWHAAWVASILSLPFWAVLLVWQPFQWWLPLLATGIGMGFSILIILAKYAAYPAAIGLPQAILIGISGWFPPFFLVVGPFFYQKAVQRITSLLT